MSGSGSKKDKTKGIIPASAQIDREFLRDIQSWKSNLERKLRIRVSDARFTNWIRRQEVWREVPHHLDPRRFFP